MSYSFAAQHVWPDCIQDCYYFAFGFSQHGNSCGILGTVLFPSWEAFKSPACCPSKQQPWDTHCEGWEELRTISAYYKLVNLYIVPTGIY